MTLGVTPEFAILVAAEKAHSGEPALIEAIAGEVGVDAESVRLMATLMGGRGLALVDSLGGQSAISHITGITIEGRVRLSRLRRTQ